MDLEHFAFSLLIGQVGVLGFTWFIIVRSHQRMVYRDRIFAIRDRMFIYMGEKGLPYDLPAYVHLRYLFNGAIRFSDRIDLFSLSFIILFESLRGNIREIINTYDKKCETARDTIKDNPEVSAKLKEFKNQFTKETENLLIYSSIICIIANFVSNVFGKVLKTNNFTKKNVKRRFKKATETYSYNSGKFALAT